MSHPTRGSSAVARRLTLLAFAALALALALPAVAASANLDVTRSPYNARGDGRTNDRVAIQTAIDDANSAGLRAGVIEVILPGGTAESPKVYLSGNLVLKSHVSLHIARYATLKQSQTPSDYSPVPGVGRTVDTIERSFRWNYWMYKNKPFIFADSGTTETAVSGADAVESRIEMTHSALDPAPFERGCPSPADDPGTRAAIYCHSIHMFAIGFFNAEAVGADFVHITGAGSVGIGFYNVRGGGVTHMTFDGVTDVNAAGIEVRNSQDLYIGGNTLEPNEDGIAVASVGRGDPRCGAGYWCQDYSAAFTDNIEIVRNTVRASGVGHDLAWVPWGANDVNTGITDVYVHGNRFSSAERPSAYCWCDDPFNPNGRSLTEWDDSENDQGASWDVRFERNTYTGETGTMQKAAIHDLNVVSDSIAAVNPLWVANGGFETGNGLDWSSDGESGTQAGLSNARDGQDGVWEGYIQRWDHGYVTMWQGVSLGAGLTYTVSVFAKTSGDTARLYVFDPCAGRSVRSRTFSNREWETITMSVTPPTNCSTFEVGVDNSGGGTSSTAWAKFDDLTISTPVEDSEDPRVVYSSTWGTKTNWGPLATQNIGGWQPYSADRSASYTVTFTGTRARLLVGTGSNCGMANISVDGRLIRSNVDFYSRSDTYQVGIFETGTLSSGTHTIRVANTGTKNASSSNYYLTFDALLVTP